jgi:hypothetical protein
MFVHFTVVDTIGGSQIGRLMIIGSTELSYTFRAVIYDEGELPGGLDG